MNGVYRSRNRLYTFPPTVIRNALFSFAASNGYAAHFLSSAALLNDFHIIVIRFQIHRIYYVER